MRAANSIHNWVASPNQTMASALPNMPISRIGFRPTRSDRLPQTGPQNRRMMAYDATNNPNSVPPAPMLSM